MSRRGFGGEFGGRGLSSSGSSGSIGDKSQIEKRNEILKDATQKVLAGVAQGVSSFQGSRRGPATEFTKEMYHKKLAEAPIKAGISREIVKNDILSFCENPTSSMAWAIEFVYKAFLLDEDIRLFFVEEKDILSKLKSTNGKETLHLEYLLVAIQNYYSEEFFKAPETNNKSRAVASEMLTKLPQHLDTLPPASLHSLKSVIRILKQGNIPAPCAICKDNSEISPLNRIDITFPQFAIVGKESVITLTYPTSINFGSNPTFIIESELNMVQTIQETFSRKKEDHTFLFKFTPTRGGIFNVQIKHCQSRKIPNGDFTITVRDYSNMGNPNEITGEISGGRSRFNVPWGVGFNGETLLVTDTDDHKFYSFGESPKIFSLGGTPSYPRGIQFHEEHFYVAVTQNYLSVLDHEGSLVRTIGEGLNRPRGFSIGFERIVICSTDSCEVHFLNESGSSLKILTDFNYPLCSAMFDHPQDGKIVAITDCDNHRIIILDLDGNIIRKFGGPNTFQKPIGIAFDPCGNLVIADSENARIQVFTTEGEHIASFGSDFLESPKSIAVSPSGTIAIADDKKKKVFLFKIE